MSSSCDHNCSGCAENCEERDPKSFLEEVNSKSHVKKVIGIVSGKGGVGKSLVTSLLASGTQKKGYATAVLDADITGPSIPMMFGVHKRAKASEDGIVPEITKNGTKIMSLNLLTDNETDPVIWRGPVIAGLVKQFWTDVVWGDIDVMFIDMPPGTGDVPLTVFQSIPIDGIVVVSTPQELVGMIVEKALKMADRMNIPVIGLVENMSYVKCPDCDKEIKVFGESHIDDIAELNNLKVLAKIPLEANTAAYCDNGKIEDLNLDYLDNAVEMICK